MQKNAPIFSGRCSRRFAGESYQKGKCRNLIANPLPVWFCRQGRIGRPWIAWVLRAWSRLLLRSRRCNRVYGIATREIFQNIFLRCRPNVQQGGCRGALPEMEILPCCYCFGWGPSFGGDPVSRVGVRLRVDKCSRSFRLRRLAALAWNFWSSGSNLSLVLWVPYLPFWYYKYTTFFRIIKIFCRKNQQKTPRKNRGAAFQICLMSNKSNTMKRLSSSADRLYL